MMQKRSLYRKNAIVVRMTTYVLDVQRIVQVELKQGTVILKSVKGRGGWWKKNSIVSDKMAMAM